MKRLPFLTIAVLPVILFLSACRPATNAPLPRQVEEMGPVEPTVPALALYHTPVVTIAPPTTVTTAVMTTTPSPTVIPTTTPAPTITVPPQTLEPTTGSVMSPATTIAVPDACPKPTDAAYLLVNPLGGYCLLYPDTHTAVRGGFDSGEPAGIRIVDGSILNTDLWATITVGEDTGEDIAQSSRDYAAGLAEYGVEFTEIEVAGQPAYMLTGLFGQDLTRSIRLKHDGLIYNFQIGPDDVPGTELYKRISEFTGTLLDSLTFLPVTDVLTLSDVCLQPRPDEKLIINEALDFCLLIPDAYDYEEPDPNSAAFLSGPVVDAAHPRLLINVVDDERRTAGELTDDLIKQMNELTGEWILIRMYTIGDGNTLVTMIDGAPGHELERLLFVDHEDRLYQFSFTPYDPAQPELTGAVQALILKVTQSFRFLP